MARTAVLAAGGIVLRQEETPLIAVVRLRKRNEWVLPKGKLDDGETPRDAAEREVLEETGHDVSVHEFLGTLAYDLGGRSKIVHYWRMEARGGQVHELMSDVREVDWLPLPSSEFGTVVPDPLKPTTVYGVGYGQGQGHGPSRHQPSPSVVYSAKKTQYAAPRNVPSANIPSTKGKASRARSRKAETSMPRSSRRPGTPRVAST